MPQTSSPSQISLDERHAKILRHALGLERNGERRSFRNHFSTAAESTDYDLCMEMVDSGHMVLRRSGFQMAGAPGVIFGVTSKGVEFITNGLGLSERGRGVRRDQAYETDRASRPRAGA